MMIEKIRAYYAQAEKDRTWGSPLRCSGSGKCARAIAYQMHGFEPEPINFRGRMVFRLGDLIESDLVDACANCYPDFKAGKEYTKYVGGDLYKAYEQFEVQVEVAGLVLTGHLDGYIEKDGKPYCIVDFKSMSSFGFKRAEKGEIEDSYLAQAHCYMKGMDCKNFLFVCYCKDTSALCEVAIKWKDSEWDKVVERFKKVAASTKEALPDREHGVNAKGNLPWQCSYCGFCRHCWPGVELTYSDHGKPILTPKKEA